MSSHTNISESNVNNALVLAEKSIPVFPVHGLTDGRCTCGNTNCDNPGKHPRIKGWQDSATTNTEQKRKWARIYPGSRWGIPTGSLSGITVLDQDDRHGGDTRLSDLEATYGPLPQTATIRTASGGTHYWFKANGLSNSVGDKTKLGHGLDIRGDGGFAIAYEVPQTFETAEMPRWVKVLAETKARESYTLRPNSGFNPDEYRSGVPEGSRDDTIWRGVCWYRAMDKPIEEAIAWATEVAANSDFDTELAEEKAIRAYEAYEPNEVSRVPVPYTFGTPGTPITVKELCRNYVIMRDHMAASPIWWLAWLRRITRRSSLEIRAPSNPP